MQWRGVAHLPAASAPCPGGGWPQTSRLRRLRGVAGGTSASCLMGTPLGRAQPDAACRGSAQLRSSLLWMDTPGPYMRGYPRLALVWQGSLRCHILCKGRVAVLRAGEQGCRSLERGAQQSLQVQPGQHFRRAAALVVSASRCTASGIHYQMCELRSRDNVERLVPLHSL